MQANSLSLASVPFQNRVANVSPNSCSRVCQFPTCSYALMLSGRNWPLPARHLAIFLVDWMTVYPQKRPVRFRLVKNQLGRLFCNQ